MVVVVVVSIIDLKPSAPSPSPFLLYCCRLRSTPAIRAPRIQPWPLPCLQTQPWPPLTLRVLMITPHTSLVLRWLCLTVQGIDIIREWSGVVIGKRWYRGRKISRELVWFYQGAAYMPPWTLAQPQWYRRCCQIISFSWIRSQGKGGGAGLNQGQ